ncbi:hypothetical protein ENH_00074290 [Eimeria necatrix]|uniref:Uncharacterized protein n=1 Tax=Eimeria necatrix TaxID=51315 RepID=U6N2W6_9EIME|nr:hypothetical protein ENH_00074290 [Eimeria necatrix]CDJ69644.1 hypothetical protein ENH_00074290 [Eimeria necatrix]
MFEIFFVFLNTKLIQMCLPAFF